MTIGISKERLGKIVYYVKDGTDIMGFDTKAEAARYILAEKGRSWFVESFCDECGTPLVKAKSFYRCAFGHECLHDGTVIEE